MIKYAKIINEETGLCDVGLGTDIDYYKSIGMVELDVEQSEKDGQWYLSDKCPHYTPEEKRKREEERINNLTMTALDFVNFLKLAGLTDQNIEDYLNANLEVKHQLQFCQNVYCGVAKALMPITYEGITITAEMVERAFIEKNKEG
jgi:hypothetical protein